MNTILYRLNEMGMLVLNSITNPGPMPILNCIKSQARIFEPTTTYSRQKLKQDLKTLVNADDYVAHANKRTVSNAVSLSPSSPPEISSLTPSLSSVRCQIKKRNKERRNTDSTVASSNGSLNSVLSSSGEPFESSSDSVFNNSAFKTDSKTLQYASEQDHPLCDAESDLCTPENKDAQMNEPQTNAYETLPHTKMFNMNDLIFMDTFTEDDILQPITPIYKRPKNTQVEINPIFSSALDQTLTSKLEQRRNFKPIFLQDEVVEMEHWPNSSQQQRLQDSSIEFISPGPLAQKRTRQQSLNPSFLRLYALETSMKQKKLLPDLDLDESILQRLSVQEISQLNIPPDPSNRVSSHQIKLALITRKKLWSDMCQITRTDLHGESAPSNLKFVNTLHSNDSSSGPSDEDKDTQEATSLVRLNSEVKPWSQPEMSQPTMFKPCGRIPLGRNVNSKEIQYVVKGWCDYRFA